MDIKALIARYPHLYHMAEKDTWPSIKMNGLLSTIAILDRYGVKGRARLALEEEHRPEKVVVGIPGNQMILRDQKPMKPSRLQDALVDGTTPQQWYKFLNGKVFTWAEEHRLFRLLGAREYKTLEHDVLTINTAKIMANHASKVWLCHMNSGNTFPMPHARSMATFKRILAYPTKRDGVTPEKEVVEVVFDYSIPDIAEYIVEVRRIQGQSVLKSIPI